jgi:hypothetical protein
MTEYDAFAVYREQEEKNKVSAMEADHGIITYYFTDGTTEQWKKNWFGKIRKIKSRSD